MRIADFDDAYQNAAYIAGADQFLVDWPMRAAQFRAQTPHETLTYGPGPRQFCDLFRPKGRPAGLVIFIHGGYWLRFSARDFSHLAQGARDCDYAVGMINYPLAPEARIGEITRHVAHAVALLAAQVAGPIRLAGHSAGGHLATRMVCEGVLEADIAARLAHTVSISGVHDLRPLRLTKINETLRLDGREASEESPALCTPLRDVPVTALVGAQERPEFLRQTDLLANIWLGLGADVTGHHLAGKHHFDVIDSLAEADGRVTRLLLEAQ